MGAVAVKSSVFNSQTNNWSEVQRKCLYLAKSNESKTNENRLHALIPLIIPIHHFHRHSTRHPTFTLRGVIIIISYTMGLV